MADYMSLIERLEKATGPDRELDCAVYEASGLARLDPDQPHWRWIKGTTRHSDYSVPDFTQSIDAALSLVPKDWRVQLDEWDSDVLRAHGPWLCILVRKGQRGNFATFDSRCNHAPSPAIALCIAALKAHSLIGKKEG